MVSASGLPVGLFSNRKNPNLGNNLVGLEIGNVLFHDHLEYFSVIWDNLRPFGLVCGHLVYFSS
jgi:hypothetical protein